jgi:hypothetical protein
MAVTVGLALAIGFSAALAWAAPAIAHTADPVAGPALTLVAGESVTGTHDISNTEHVTGTGQLMIAAAIAGAFDVSVDEVLAVRDQGFGWGEVFKAFWLASLVPGKTVDQILALRADDQGWGQIAKALGLPPGQGKHNLGQTIKTHKPSDTATVGNTTVNHPVHPANATTHGNGNPSVTDKGKSNPKSNDHGNGHGH